MNNALVGMITDGDRIKDIMSVMPNYFFIITEGGRFFELWLFDDKRAMVKEREVIQWNEELAQEEMARIKAAASANSEANKRASKIVTPPKGIIKP